MVETFDTEFLTRALTRIIKDANRPHQVHVGSVDSWPELIRGENVAMIFNTEYLAQPGEHWVAVYVDGESQSGIVFDSLPVRPFPQLVLNKLGKLCVSVYNANPERYILQHPEYPLCGIYCLAFLHCFANKKTLKLCSNNQLMNDVFVLDVVLPYLK